MNERNGDDSPYTPPKMPTGTSGNFSIAKAALVLILAVAVAFSSIIVMVGPQLMLIVPLCLLAGLAFAVRRSFWSLVCFGYPLTFGLTSAWIGYKEMPGYERTMNFAISIGIGIVGVVLVATGLGKALLGTSGRDSSPD